jgi:hypothetical protein
MDDIKFYQDKKYKREVTAINYTAKTIMQVNDDGASSGISFIPPEYFALNLHSLQLQHMEQISETWFQTVRLSALIKVSNDIYSPRQAA